MEEMTLANKELTLATKAVLQEHQAVEMAFSKVSRPQAERMLKSRGITEGRAVLPTDFFSSFHASSSAHEWQGTTEVGESERLLSWLKRNVSSARDAPVDNFFYDVQGLAATQPMVIR